MSYTAVQADTGVITDEYTELPAELADELAAGKTPLVVYLAGEKAAAAVAGGLSAKTAVLYETKNGRAATALGLAPLALGEKTKALLVIIETPGMERDIYPNIMPAVANLEMIVSLGSNVTYLSEAATVVLPTAGLNEISGHRHQLGRTHPESPCSIDGTGRCQMPLRSNQPAF